MDLDCLGSMVLAKYLFPDHVVIRSRLSHPIVKNELNLFKGGLEELIFPRDLKGQLISKVVIVDTRTSNRINEYLEFTDQTIYDVKDVTIFDHHVTDVCDIPHALLISENLGSNVAIMVKRLIENNLTITPEDATIAMTGLYGDTGAFTFDSTTQDDYAAGSWLLGQGANLSIVKKFLQPMKEESQIDIFHRVMNRLEVKKIQGHYILFSYLNLPRQISGLGGVVEKIMDIEGPDAFFLLAAIEKSNTTLIIGRSQKDRINIHDLLQIYGGGGHGMAASAKLDSYKSEDFIEQFEWHLHRSLLPSVSAGTLMTEHVHSLREDMTLLEASMFLEEIHHTGCPVLNVSNDLVGVLTLRDISKGRMAGQMNSPVKAYMAKKIETFTPDSSVREIEHLFLSKNIGHIPVVVDKKVVGIVTRNDFLDHLRKANIKI